MKILNFLLYATIQLLTIELLITYADKTSQIIEKYWGNIYLNVNI